jgi:two-component system sensor histidine kinase TctE
MMKHSASITTRLAVAIALILGAGGVGIALAALAYGRQAADEAYDKLLAGAVFEIARSVSLIEGELVVNLPVSAFEILALAPEDRVFYRIFTPNGATLTGYELAPPSAALIDDVVFYGSEFRGEKIRLAAMRKVFAERAFVGDVSVIVGQTLRARSALAWDITSKALAIVAAAGLMLIVLAVFAVNSSLIPLRKIEQALLRRDPTDLTPLQVHAPREVRTMVGAIDRFMARLSRRVTGMQNLIADATHQLRTPVAALRAQAELASNNTDPDELRAIAGRIHRRAIGLGRLTDQLLNQALIIHRADAAAHQEVDLRQVAIQVSEEADHDLYASGATLRLDLPAEPVTVGGDALSLVEAMKNLVNNAFRYGKVPITILVATNGEASISVIDHGEGIPEADRANSGRRFARTGGSAPDSAGLGLAIVRAVAEAHGGRLIFSSGPGQRFKASLSFPQAGDDSA